MRTLIFVTLLVAEALAQAPAATPQAVVDQLLAADRAFSSASSQTDLVNGLSAMLADQIVLTHAGGIASGKAAAVDALEQNKANAGARLAWTPLRAAISGDGRHGFTAGFMTLRTADGKESPLKYLAYWEKQAAGWRVLAYKRGGAKVMPPLTPMANVLPATLVAPATDVAVIEQYRKSLADAETAFSADAQTMGIGPAFAKYGSPDALNLGGPDEATFVIGNQAIGIAVGGGSTAPGSPVSWGPDFKTIVAASGDFGVTIGHIVPNALGPDGKPQPGRPFFTIWHRANPSAPWRYIAE